MKKLSEIKKEADRITLEINNLKDKLLKKEKERSLLNQSISLQKWTNDDRPYRARIENVHNREWLIVGKANGICIDFKHWIPVEAFKDLADFLLEYLEACNE